MKSIERTFDAIKERNPYLGTYVIFAETVKQTQPNYRILKLWFSKLVDKADYFSSEKTQLLSHLKSLITPPTMYKNHVNFSLSVNENRKEYTASL